MPLVRLKDGSLVRVDEMPTADELRTRGASLVGRSARTTVSTPRDRISTEAAARVKERRAAASKSPLAGILGNSQDYGAGEKMADAYTFHLGDVIGSGVVGAARGITKSAREGFKGNGLYDKVANTLNNVGHEYKVEREVERQRENAYDQRNPGTSTAASLVGAIANPIGAETGLGRLATKVAPKAAARVAASGAGRLASRIGNSAVGIGARAAGNQMAIETAVNTGDLGETAEAYATGLGLGGALGGAGAMVGRGVHAWKDRRASEAPRVAYNKIAEMLDNAVVPETGGKARYTPASAVNEMKAAAKGGSDPILADLSPQMQAYNAHLALKPNLSTSSEIADRANARSLSAGQRWTGKVEKTLKASPDAHTRLKQIKTGQKAAAEVDYRDGGPLDNAVPLTDEMKAAFKDSPDSDRWLQEGFKYAQRFGHKNLGTIDPNTNELVPSARVYDYMMQAANDEIGAALKGEAPKVKLAAGLSAQLQRFKDIVGRANPELRTIWGTQRDFFQQRASVDIGTKFLDTLKGTVVGKDARSLLEKMTAEGVSQQDLKIGLADALMNMAVKGDNPAALMRKFMRSDAQRLALKHVFGDNKTLNEFHRFINRELRAMRTDKLADIHAGSPTAGRIGIQDMDEVESLMDVGKSVMQGAAFGGKLGAISKGVRSADMLASGLGPRAQEELSRILNSKGKGLVEGVESARKFAEERARRAAARRVKASKGMAHYIMDETSE